MCVVQQAKVAINNYLDLPQSGAFLEYSALEIKSHLKVS